MAMPMEVYSTESAFLFCQSVAEEPAPGVSFGYHEVVLATALISLMWFLMDLARKELGSMGIFPRFKILSRKSHKPHIRHLQRSSVAGDDGASFATKGGGGSIPPAPWKLSMPKIPVLSSSVTMNQIRKWFPGAIVTQDLVLNIKDALEPYGYGETSLIATSLCSDEVNRSLEKDLFEVYEHHFAMGGLAGVPFGGVTAFGAMAHHIPDGGSCLIVYGPHVGIDKEGNLGTVNRRGRSHGGACCGSAIAACHHVTALLEQGDKKTKHPDDVTDAQQTFVQNMLLPYGNRLQFSEEPMAELPYAMYDAQTELIEKIVQKGCGQVAGDGKIALLGGIQINTPKGMSDYFLPLRFDIFDNKGAVVANLKRGPPRAPISKIASTFPRALPNAKLIEKVQTSLAPFGYGKNSLLCTSLCCDEVNRPLEHELWDAFGDHFNIGGLAGFAFGGATGFAAMAHHIPDGGNCIIVYGPHVGVDSKGNVGTVDRRGRSHGGACCGSGVAAAKYVEAVSKGEKKADMPVDPLDAQQAYVGDMLLPYADQLAQAEDPMVELPFSLFQAQDKLMQKIVLRKRNMIPGNGRIALLGGIQINTPDGVSDFFLPLRFEVLRNSGNQVVDLLFEKKVKEVEDM